MSGSGISWDICKSAPRSRQITMPEPHRSVFLQAGCPSCRPTNSVKALKAVTSASSALAVLNDYALYKSTHSLTHWVGGKMTVHVNDERTDGLIDGI